MLGKAFNAGEASGSRQGQGTPAEFNKLFETGEFQLGYCLAEVRVNETGTVDSVRRSGSLETITRAKAEPARRRSASLSIRSGGCARRAECQLETRSFERRLGRMNAPRMLLGVAESLFQWPGKASPFLTALLEVTVHVPSDVGQVGIPIAGQRQEVLDQGSVVCQQGS